MTDEQRRKRLEYCREYYRKWRAMNHSKSNLYSMRWRKKNHAKYRAYQRNYEWSLPKNNHMRIGRLLRCRIIDALNGRSKSDSLTGLLGCNLHEFSRHIESQFGPEMTWENHGTVWHIDHKKACASFDLSTEQGQRDCFHFSNHQPLTVAENLRKSDSGRRRR